MAEEGPTEAELAAAKKYVDRRLCHQQSGFVRLHRRDTGRAADSTSSASTTCSGAPPSSTAVTLDQVKAAAKKLLSAEPAVMVVGPRSRRAQGVKAGRRRRAAEPELRRRLRRRRRARAGAYPRHRGAGRAGHQAGRDRRLLDRRHHGRRHGRRHDRQGHPRLCPLDPRPPRRGGERACGGRGRARIAEAMQGGIARQPVQHRAHPQGVPARRDPRRLSPSSKIPLKVTATDYFGHSLAVFDRRRPAFGAGRLGGHSRRVPAGDARRQAADRRRHLQSGAVRPDRRRRRHHDRHRRGRRAGRGRAQAADLHRPDVRRHAN